MTLGGLGGGGWSTPGGACTQYPFPAQAPQPPATSLTPQNSISLRPASWLAAAHPLKPLFTSGPAGSVARQWLLGNSCQVTTVVSQQRDHETCWAGKRDRRATSLCPGGG